MKENFEEGFDGLSDLIASSVDAQARAWDIVGRFVVGHDPKPIKAFLLTLLKKIRDDEELRNDKSVAREVTESILPLIKLLTELEGFDDSQAKNVVRMKIENGLYAN